MMRAPPPERAKGSVVFLDCPDRSIVLLMVGGANTLLTRGPPYTGQLISKAAGFEHISAAHLKFGACGWAPNRILFAGMRQLARSVLNFLVEHAAFNAPSTTIKLANIRNTFVSLYNKWAAANDLVNVKTCNASRVFRILGRVHKACVANEFGGPGKSPWKFVWNCSDEPVRFVTLDAGTFLHNDSLPARDGRFTYARGHKVIPFLICGANVQFFTSIGDPLLTDERVRARAEAIGCRCGPEPPLTIS